jgi:hypothetical protein
MAPFPCIATNTSPPLGGGAKKNSPRGRREKKQRGVAERAYRGGLSFFRNTVVCTEGYALKPVADIPFN